MPDQKDNERKSELMRSNSDSLILEILHKMAATPNIPTEVNVPYQTVGPLIVTPLLMMIHGLSKLAPDELAIYKIDIFTILQTLAMTIAATYHFDEKQIPEVYKTIIEADRHIPSFLIFAGVLRAVMEMDGGEKKQPESYAAVLKYITRNNPTMNQKI